jgi:hypothetical protein
VHNTYPVSAQPLELENARMGIKLVSVSSSSDLLKRHADGYLGEPGFDTG